MGLCSSFAVINFFTKHSQVLQKYAIYRNKTLRRNGGDKHWCGTGLCGTITEAAAAAVVLHSRRMIGGNRLGQIGDHWRWVWRAQHWNSIQYDLICLKGPVHLFLWTKQDQTWRSGMIMWREPVLKTVAVCTYSEIKWKIKVILKFSIILRHMFVLPDNKVLIDHCHVLDKR